MKFSSFGSRFARESGARMLMDDLGEALASGNMLMLGGGNPSRIPAVEALLAARLRAIADDPSAIARMIGNYAAPQGERDFIVALARLMRDTCGWNVGPRNIALTSGSQAAFFALFNMLAGDFDDGTHRRILLPLTPEYVGYTELGLSDDLFVSRRPTIETGDDHLFKYHVDFSGLEVGDDVAAICVSRPTNPTGNVLADDEMERLRRLAAARGIPLIVDNAYGLPFPGIVFRDAVPVWDENIVLCMSLSKIGLPAVRTGIVVAREEIIDGLAGVTAITSLAPPSVGPALMLDLVTNGGLLDLCRDLVTPHYHGRMRQALGWVHEAFAGTDYYVHRPEGAIFLWLWFPDLPITSLELYRRLKARGVLVLPGNYFFPGMREPWRHRDECLRITYAQEPGVVREGIRLIADEVRRARDGDR